MTENLPDVNLDEIEKRLLSPELTQVECKVEHFFGPGLYIRQVTLPAGLIVMGHAHKQDNMNIMIKGKLLLLRDDGEVATLEAPQTFVNGPGRKVAYVIEETVWQNVHATEETDLDRLEDMYIQKSQAWLEADEIKRLSKARKEIELCHG